eukprot:m.136686 g.136686  ORF g.136686 m.136686 type:complete len:508 (+) comp13954_c0_seq1:365-1888(+)
MMQMEGMGVRPAPEDAFGSEARRKRARLASPNGHTAGYSAQGTRQYTSPTRPGKIGRPLKGGLVQVVVQGPRSPPVKAISPTPLLHTAQTAGRPSGVGPLNLGRLEDYSTPRYGNLTPTPNDDSRVIDAATTLAFLLHGRNQAVHQLQWATYRTMATPSPSAGRPTFPPQFQPVPAASDRAYASFQTPLQFPPQDVVKSTPHTTSGATSTTFCHLDSPDTRMPPPLEATTICEPNPHLAVRPPAPAKRQHEDSPPARPFLVTTFRTRSRQETKVLQMEAARNNRRYIPPAREVLQTLYGPTDPPSRPADAEDETTFPIIRIGDTIEMKFTPSTPFDKLCHGYELEPKGQVALGFGSDNADGVRSLEFEVLHHAGEDGLACLRCQQELPKCCCGYANDLLEINRDWKAKKDPTRRLGLRAFDDGVVGVALRIPRTRRPLTAEERAANLPDRPNTWNSRLKQRSQKDAKVVMIRLTERLTRSSGASVVLSVHQTYARLIAKNGGFNAKK